MSVGTLLVGEITGLEGLRGPLGREAWQIMAETLNVRVTPDLIESLKPDVVTVGAANAEHEREKVLRLAHAFAYTRMILLCEQDSPERW